MKKFLILSLSLVLLASCMNKEEAPAAGPSSKKPETTQGSGSNTSTPQAIAGKDMLVSLNYTLHDGSPAGKVIETTLQEVAKTNNLDKTGSVYKPFQVVLGKNAVIPGFEAGITGMKKGEKKMIEVLPKDGYGELAKEEQVDKYQLAPEFTMTLEKERFMDNITRTVTKAELGDQAKDISVGKVITGGQGMSAEVKAIEGDNVTLSISNKSNPFYGKSLFEGATAEAESGSILFKIVSISGSGITVNIVNKKSVFTKETFVKGGSADTPSGKVTIKSIDNDKVTIVAPNPHPLAGKTLYFDVEVTDIK